MPPQTGFSWPAAPNTERAEEGGTEVVREGASHAKQISRSRFPRVWTTFSGSGSSSNKLPTNKFSVSPCLLPSVFGAAGPSHFSLTPGNAGHAEAQGGLGGISTKEQKGHAGEALPLLLQPNVHSAVMGHPITALYTLCRKREKRRCPLFLHDLFVLLCFPPPLPPPSPPRLCLPAPLRESKAAGVYRICRMDRISAGKLGRSIDNTPVLRYGTAYG